MSMEISRQSASISQQNITDNNNNKTNADTNNKNKRYMVVGALDKSGNLDRSGNKLCNADDKSFKSSASSIAEFLHTDKGQTYLQQLKPESKERIYTFLCNKAFNRSSVSKVLDLIKNFFGGKTNKEHYKDALKALHEAEFSGSSNQVSSNVARSKLEAHIESHVDGPHQKLEDTMSAVQKYVEGNKSLLISDAKSSPDGAIHIKKEKSGLSHGITVTKDGSAFIHIKKAFAEGGQQKIKFGIEVFTQEVIARGVSSTPITASEDDDMANGDAGNLNEVIKKIAGSNNVIDVHTVISDKGASAIISHFCSGGDVNSRCPLSISSSTPLHYFANEANKSEELHERFTIGDSSNKSKTEVIKELMHDAINIHNKLEQVVNNQRNDRKNGTYDEEKYPERQILEDASKKNPLYEMLNLYSASKLKEAFKIDEDTVAGLILDGCEGIKTEITLKKKESFSEASLAIAAFQMASGIVSIHDKGCSHGDVKPENFLLDSNSQVVIADLNSAIDIEKVLSHQQTPDFAGTDAYKAPEIAQDRKVSAKLYDRKTNKEAVENVKKQDVYSYGASLFEMENGKNAPASDPEVIGLKAYNDMPSLAISDKLKELSKDRAAIDPEPSRGTLSHLAWRARDPNPVTRPKSHEIQHESAKLMMSNHDAAEQYIKMKENELKKFSDDVTLLTTSSSPVNPAKQTKLEQKLEQFTQEMKVVIAACPKNTDKDKGNKLHLEFLHKKADSLLKKIEKQS